VGALLTGVFAAPSLGGTGVFDYVANAASADYSIGGQVLIQLEAVVTTLVWSGVVSYIGYKIVDMVVGLRVTEEEEREGLDISSQRNCLPPLIFQVLQVFLGLHSPHLRNQGGLFCGRLRCRLGGMDK
jgi:ammonia channel protein AmtB